MCPRARELGIRRFPVPSRASRVGSAISPALAPASGPTLLRAFPSSSRDPKIRATVRQAPVLDRRLRGRTGLGGRASVRFVPLRSEDRYGRPFLPSDRTIRPVSKTFGASFSTAFPHWTEVRWQTCLQGCVDRFSPRLPGLKSIEISGFYAANPETISSRSDVLKLRLRGRVGKRRKPRLSTARRFRCGGEWISSPLIAKLK